MLKSANTLSESDPRFRDYVFVDPDNGSTRPMQINDLLGMVGPIELSAAVPDIIREQFDIARNVFVYSWFVYEFATLAEQQTYAVLEMGLRHRLYSDEAANTTKSPGLSKLIKQAIDKGLLNRAEFTVPYSNGDKGGICLLDFMPMSRNHIMHGNVQLLPQGTTTTMKTCADVLNAIFSSEVNEQRGAS